MYCVIMVLVNWWLYADTSLSGGIISAIVIVILFFIVLVAIVVAIFKRKRKQKIDLPSEFFVSV